MTAATNGFDFHCHVDLFPDPPALIADCDRNRIVTVAVTTTPKAWTKNRRWAERSEFVFPAIGLHPELVAQRHAEIAMVEQFMTETPFVGEIGLDGSAPHRGSLPIQIEVFSRALRSAERLGGRVLSVHSRRAGREVIARLAECTTPKRVLPILHWFSDSKSLAAEAVQHGCYFSINRLMLLSGAGRSLVESLPTDRLLTETDAPFSEVDGRRLGPCDVALTTSHLADVCGVPIGRMQDVVVQNARRVLAFAGVSTPP